MGYDYLQKNKAKLDLEKKQLKIGKIKVPIHLSKSKPINYLRLPARSEIKIELETNSKLKQGILERTELTRDCNIPHCIIKNNKTEKLRQAKENVNESKEKSKIVHDKNISKIRQFKINDKVLIIRKRKGTQKTKPFRDVHKIIEIYNNNTAKIQNTNKLLETLRINIEQIKHFPDGEPDLPVDSNDNHEE